MKLKLKKKQKKKRKRKRIIIKTNKHDSQFQTNENNKRNISKSNASSNFR